MTRRAWAVALGCLATGCATPVAPRSQAQGAKAPTKAEPANFFADLAIGAGNYEHDTKGDGGGASGDTGGAYLRLRTEYLGDSGLGGGLALEGAGSDDDIFEDAGSVDAEASMGDLFLYFAAVPTQSDAFRLPIRFGPYVHAMGINEDSTDTKLTWGGLGVRLDVEPEFWIIRRENFSFGFVGDLSAGAHVTSIELDVLGATEDFDGNGLTLGADVGVQALFGKHVSTRLGYVYRTTHEAESDATNGIVIREADQTFSGVALQVGLRF